MSRKKEMHNENIIDNKSDNLDKGNSKETNKEKDGTIKVKFKSTYIGTHGNFYSGKVYKLTAEQYKLFKEEVEEIK